MIPLLPPLVEFMDPKSLCRYGSASKTLQKDVRDTKAWALLARAQLPRKTRDAASDALSQVKSYVRRRLLADAMAQETPQPQTFRPNEIEDFTFFVRFEEDASPTRATPCHRDRYRRRASPSPTPTRPPPRGRARGSASRRGPRRGTARTARGRAAAAAARGGKRARRPRRRARLPSSRGRGRGRGPRRRRGPAPTRPLWKSPSSQLRLLDGVLSRRQRGRAG